MAKVQKVFACTECGSTYSKWAGQCSACEAWNTIQEEVLVKETPKEAAKKAWRKGGKKEKPRPKKLQQIETGSTQRREMEDGELNRVLGGGLVEGSMILLGGEPGIGKSTLMLQLALSLDAKVLYISGEESEEQIKMRANRLGKTPENCYIMSDTSLTNVLMQAQLRKSLRQRRRIQL
jgi:DNA repair protein RadA/Sms